MKSSRGGCGGMTTSLAADLCAESSLHGLPHIAAPRRHALERWFWVLAVCLGAGGAAAVAAGQFARFLQAPTVVTLEKDFRSWRYPLPALTHCPENRVDVSKLPGVVARVWNVSAQDEAYGYLAGFVTAVANADLYHLDALKQYEGDPELDVDLFDLVVQVGLEAGVKATWPGGETPRWTPVVTESGLCHVTNCRAAADQAPRPLPWNETRVFPITCKYSAIGCNLNLEVLHPAHFYIHSSYDIAEVSEGGGRVFLTLSRSVQLSAVETRAGPGVSDLAPPRRQCRYVTEPTAPRGQVHSLNSCRRACRNRLALHLCGCRPFYYSREEGAVCGLRGLSCLTTHARRLADERCACAPQCLDVVYREVLVKDQIWEQGPFTKQGSLRYTLQVPRTRYTRVIVFHFQDLVVSFGGAAGLFLGASFISFVELAYLLLTRACRANKPNEPVTGGVRGAGYERRACASWMPRYYPLPLPPRLIITPINIFKATS